MSRRAAILVLDGLGIGPAPDTDAYGDAGSNTLGNVARAVGGLRLPNLEALGLGCCAPLAGMRAVERPGAAYGVAEPTSPGKDSTTGHWELCGLVLERTVSHLSARLSRRGHRRVRAPHGAGGARQPAGLRNAGARPVR